MSMEYIRKTYGVQVRRGMRVKCKAWDGWCDGAITSATHYVIVRPDKWPNKRLMFHPLDSDNLIYITNNIEELTLMLDVINSSIVTGLGMPEKDSPCHKKILELMERNGRKPTAGQS